MRCMRWIVVLGAGGLLAFPWPIAAAQQDATPNPQTPPPAAAPATPAPAHKKHGYFDGFLIKGTVYTPEGLSFPNAEVLIRRGRDKQFRWKLVTNPQGEFAVRVPHGAEYELIVRAKGYTDQSRTLEAREGAWAGSLAFHMAPMPKGTAGEKK
jgi:hypothetical protein